MPTFSDLWKQHPIIAGDSPVLDKNIYENQCAINLSAAMLRCGINLESFGGVRSWQNGKPKYPIRAEEAAIWLDKNSAMLPGKIQKFTGKEVATSFEKIKGKKGVIFIKDYYGPGLSGDQIDLFKQSRMTDTSSWFRVATGFAIQGFWSDYRKAKAIWFWQMT